MKLIKCEKRKSVRKFWGIEVFGYEFTFQKILWEEKLK